MPRQSNRYKRLESRDWFLFGEAENYTSISFWEGFDGDRKIPNISIMTTNSKPYELDIILSARSDIQGQKLIKKIGDRLKVKRENDGWWKKNIGKELKDITELKKRILEFLRTEKLVIDDLITLSSHPKIKNIDNSKFLMKIKNLNKFRDESESIQFDESIILGEREIRRVKGRFSKSEKEEVRSILAKRLIVKKKHNEIQNQLFRKLREKHPQSYLIMEEDYIDIKLETNSEIILYEVKPYDTAYKCIRESIGQLLSYCYNLSNPEMKAIKLVIYGPNKPDKSDLRYLDFLSKNITPALEYECPSL